MFYRENKYSMLDTILKQRIIIEPYKFGVKDSTGDIIKTKEYNVETGKNNNVGKTLIISFTILTDNFTSLDVAAKSKINGNTQGFYIHECPTLEFKNKIEESYIYQYVTSEEIFRDCFKLLRSNKMIKQYNFFKYVINNLVKDTNTWFFNNLKNIEENNYVKKN